jgi:lipopolysaccharide transport protein LptA
MRNQIHINKLLILIVFILVFVSGLPVISAPVGRFNYSNKKANVEIEADIAILNPDGSKEVRGNVVIKRGTLTIKGERAKFWDKENRAEVYGGVRAKDGDNILFCGLLKVYLDEEKSVATITPSIVSITRDDNNNITGKVLLKAQKIDIYHKENHIRGVGNVYVEQTTILSPKQQKEKGKTTDKMQLKSDVIDIFLDQNLDVAEGNVVITQDDMIAKAQKAKYFEKEGKLFLSGNAKTYQNLEGKVFLASDKMGAESNRAIYYTKNGKLHLFGDASTWQKDGFNEIHGEEIIYYSKEQRTVVMKALAKIYDKNAASEDKKRKDDILEKKSPTDVEKVAEEELAKLDKMEAEINKKEKQLESKMEKRKSKKDEKNAKSNIAKQKAKTEETGKK